MRNLEKHNITRIEMGKYLMRNLDMDKIRVHEFFAMDIVDCELVNHTVRKLLACDKLDSLKFITRKIVDGTPFTLISVKDVEEIRPIAHLIVRPFLGMLNIKIIQNDFEFKKKSISSREWMLDFRNKEEEKENTIVIGSIKIHDIELNNIEVRGSNETMLKAIKACADEIISKFKEVEESTKQEEVKEVEENLVVKLDKSAIVRCEQMIDKVFDNSAIDKVEVTNTNLTENVYNTLCNIRQILDPKKFIIRELYISNTGSLILKTSKSEYYTGVTRGDKIELSPVHEDFFRIITADKRHMGLYVKFTQF